MRRNHYRIFAGFFFIQNVSRGMLLTVIPLQALQVMGDAQATSTLFFAVSIGGIVTALSMSLVVRRLGNYYTYLLSGAAMGGSLVLLPSLNPWLYSLGLFLHLFAGAAAEVCLSLYVLRLIPRKAMSRFEPLRVLFTVLALSIGPFLGVYLQEWGSHTLPFVLSAIALAVTIVCFHLLRLHRVSVQVSKATSVNPLLHVGRYFRQARLRLAYSLILSRSCWWTMFVIYVPIYAEYTGLGELTGAAIVSIGGAWSLTVPFWGWVGRRYGVRFLTSCAFSTVSMMSCLVYIHSDQPMVAAYLLVFSALAGSMLDGAGNILFFRAVRGHDRPEMTAVFSTYRDAGQLLTPGLYAVLLNFYALPVVFISAGTWTLISAWYSRYIPRSMR